MTHVPARIDGDDTAYVQWHVDHDLIPPPGQYTMSEPVRIRNKGGKVVHGGMEDGVRIAFTFVARTPESFFDVTGDPPRTITGWHCVGAPHLDTATGQQPQPRYRA